MRAVKRRAARLRAPIQAFVVVALAVLVLAGCASSHHAGTSQAGGQTLPVSSSAPGSVTATKTRTFAPFDRSGTPTAGVAAHRSGSCFTTSITVARHGAYRCLAGNAILDPCFVTRASAHVLDCYAAPWSRAIELRAHSLPSATPVAHIDRPWALELSGGVRCVVTNGTPTILRGVALSYACSDGSAGLRILSGKTQHALYQASDGLVRSLTVVISWRA